MRPTDPASRRARLQVLTPVLGSVLVLGLAMPAAAHPGGWSSGRWDRGSDWDGPVARGPAGTRLAGPPEGQVIVSTHISEDPADAAALRKGVVAVSGAAPGPGAMGPEPAIYAAAVVDQFARLGYRTDAPDSAAGKIAEVHVAHETIVPEEVKKPVSGAMAVGVSNRGSAYGMAVNVDLTKPRAALVTTTLEVQIRDRATGKPLWEGRADINTREGDSKWSAGEIAAKLAAALFERFPGAGQAG